MNLDILRPRLHLIGLGGVVLIHSYEAIEGYFNRRYKAAEAQRRQLTMELAGLKQAVTNLEDAGVPAFEKPECDCTPTRLEADIFQAEEQAWNWRIYSMGCDDRTSDYALGQSDDLEAAQRDVLEVMNAITETAELSLGEVDMSVLHHVCVEVGA